MTFLNHTDIIGQLFDASVVNLTGSEFMSMVLIMLLLFIFCIIFQLPIEVSVVVMIPMFVACLASGFSVGVIGGVAFIYFGVLVGKNFITRWV